MSWKLTEFHAVQFMSFLPAKNGCPYGLFCVVKCHEITFRLEPACQQSWFFYFLHFHEEPLWPWPIVAISHRGFISFLEIAEMGEKYAVVKEAQTTVCRQSRVSCSIVLWCPNQLPLILRKPSNTEWYKCLLLLHGNKSLRLMLSKKSLTCKQCSACILQWNWAKFSVLPNA